MLHHYSYNTLKSQVNLDFIFIMLCVCGHSTISFVDLSFNNIVCKIPQYNSCTFASFPLPFHFVEMFFLYIFSFLFFFSRQTLRLNSQLQEGSKEGSYREREKSHAEFDWFYTDEHNLAEQSSESFLPHTYLSISSHSSPNGLPLRASIRILYDCACFST